ncbi:MAG: N-succinylarginine dihydrolase, partial [Chlamydiales bacterium]
MKKALEINFDGIVGPTHHHAGSSLGNIPSMKHEGEVAHPKEAALQGLKKMKLLMDLGVPQAVLPPQERPSIPLLRAFGFRGSDKEIIEKAGREAPPILRAVTATASMWAANIATASASIDTFDNKLHITVANQLNRFHRSIESEETLRLFQLIFPGFTIHPPLPKGGDLGDEGTANQTRFCRSHGEKGVYLFVYGKELLDTTPRKFPARQALEASQAVARQHGLPPIQSCFAQQNPEMIDLGVFHNDLISTGHRNIFLYHEHAFVKAEQTIQMLQEKVEKVCKCPLQAIEVTEEMLPAQRAIESYLFNSQLVTLPDDSIAMIAEDQCRALSLDWIPFPIYYCDLKQSMMGGGGPA